MSVNNEQTQPTMRSGGSAIIKASGSSGLDWLFYFKPDTNGVAYIIMTRIVNYSDYTKCAVQCVGDNYSQIYYDTDVEAYQHRFKFEGLETNKTYTFRMMWFGANSENSAYIDITRTYYCSNTTPGQSVNIVDDVGSTEIALYNTNYPRYALNIERTDNDDRDGRCDYPKSSRDLFWWVCATNYEIHPIVSSMDEVRCYRWPPGPVYVKVTYKSQINKTEIESRINEWIAWMNGLVSFSGTYFVLGSTTKKNASQINVVVGTHKQLWGYNPDDVEGEETYVWGGRWYTSYWGVGILEAKVEICCEDRYPFNQNSKLFQGIVYEELTEACGPGYDQMNINNTIFSEIAYPEKTVGGPEGESWTRDEDVIKILYGLGYLKGEEYDSYFDSEFGSGIQYNKHYSSYGPLSSSDIDLFFQINASSGSISDGEKITEAENPYYLFPTYKSGYTYKMSAIYATKQTDYEELGSAPEEHEGLSFRYTNPSLIQSVSFDLPKKPNYSSTTRIDGGYKINVSGLNTMGERYCFAAYLRDINDKDIDDGNWMSSKRATYSYNSITLNSLLYGRKYDFYLYSSYDYSIESDWIHIGEGTVAPAQPVISATEEDGVITVEWELADESNVSHVYFALYDDPDAENVVNNDNDSYRITFNNSTSGTFSFPKVPGGTYTIKARSSLMVGDTEIWCVKSSGEDHTTIEEVVVKAPPASPTNLTYTRIKRGFVASWNKVTGADSYNIQIVKDGNVLYGPFNAASLSYTIYSILNYSTAYTLQVQSVGDGMVSDWTSITAVTAPPSIELFAECGKDKIDVSWKLKFSGSDDIAAGANAEVTNIWISLYTEDNIFIDNYQVNKSDGLTSVSFCGLASGKYLLKGITEYRYYYTSTSYIDIPCVDYNGVTDTAILAGVTLETDLVPPIIGANWRIKQGYYIAWNPVSGAVAYEVQVLKDGSSVRTYNVMATEGATYYDKMIDGLQYSTTYTIRVRCKDGDGNYSDWNTITAITAPPIPEYITHYYDNETLVVNWRLEDTSSAVDEVYVNLYKSDGETLIEKKSPVNTTSGSTSFYNRDTSATYIIKAIAYYKGIACVDTNGNEFKAEWTIDPLQEEIPPPNNLRATKVKAGFIIAWDNVVSADSYNIKICQVGTNSSVVVETANTRALFYATNNLKYSGYYQIFVQSVGSTGNTSNWTSNFATTTPAIPIIEYSYRRPSDDAENKELIVSWKPDGNNVYASNIHIQLFTSNKEFVKSEWISSTSSGSINFGEIERGYYIIEAYTTNFNNEKCIDANGQAYTVILNVALDVRPLSWNWTQLYELRGGGRGTIRSTAYVPIDGKGIYPCTAEEWRKFAMKINEVRIYARSQNPGSVGGGDINLSLIKTGEYFRRFYNEAYTAIYQILNNRPYDEPIPIIQENTVLNSGLFTSIQNMLNNTILQLPEKGDE